MITITLPPGNTLALTAAADVAGNAWPFAERIGDTAGVTEIAAGASATLGPFATVKRYAIDNLTYVATPVDYPTVAEAVGATQAVLPAIIGTLGDLCEVIGEDVPAVTAQAALTVNPAGDDNSLTFTAVAYGDDGNNITIAYVDPGAPETPLSIIVTGSAIVVSIETDINGIASTAADILAAIEADAAASALVTVAVDTSDSGTADDGSGVVTAMAATSLEGGTGVGVGVAGIGSRYTDVVHGTLYLNTGTKAVPVWTQLAPVA